MENIYLVASKTLQRLRLQVAPAEIKSVRKLIAPAILPIGANNPVYNPVGGNTDVTFDLYFYVDRENREDVIEKIRWIESLTYNNGSHTTYENVLILWGDLFRGRKFILKTVETTMSLFSPQNNNVPQMAKVRLTLGQDFTGLTKRKIQW